MQSALTYERVMGSHPLPEVDPTEWRVYRDEAGQIMDSYDSPKGDQPGFPHPSCFAAVG